MTSHADEDEDDEWEDEGDEAADDSDEEPTVRCPYCCGEILEDAPWCPSCDRYISEEDHAGPRRPLWIIVTAIVCLAAALRWVFLAF